MPERVERVKQTDGTHLPINKNIFVGSIIDGITQVDGIKVIDPIRVRYYGVRKGGTRDVGVVRSRVIIFAPATNIPHANFTTEQLPQAAAEMTEIAKPVWEVLEKKLGLESSEGKGRAESTQGYLGLPLKVYVRELAPEELAQAIAKGEIPERLRGVRWVEDIEVLGFPSMEDAEIAAMEPNTIRSIAALGR